jgi:hypothetical protein
MAGPAPSEGELLCAVRDALAGREELEEDVAALAQLLRDDHFTWKVADARVAAAVRQVQAARPALRVEPAELAVLDLAALPAAGIGPRAWSAGAVEGVHHAQGGLGSTGCFLVALRGEGVVVLKQRSADFASELFAGELLRLAGVPCPRSRLLAEGELSQLLDALRPARVTVHGTCAELFSERFAEAGAYLMDFIKGRDLESRPLRFDARALPAGSAGSAAAPAASQAKRLSLWSLAPLLQVVARGGAGQGSAGQGGMGDDLCASLQRVGAMVVLDAVLNNCDRVPLWRSEGNRGNVMFCEGMQFAGAIDQRASPILSQPALSEYCAKVALLDKSAVNARIVSFFSVRAQDAAEFLGPVRQGMRVATSKLRGEPLVVQALVTTRALLRAGGLRDDAAASFDAAALEGFLARTIAALPPASAYASAPELGAAAAAKAAPPHRSP